MKFARQQIIRIAGGAVFIAEFAGIQNNRTVALLI
jgi:hypothetical protein